MCETVMLFSQNIKEWYEALALFNENGRVCSESVVLFTQKTKVLFESVTLFGRDVKAGLYGIRAGFVLPGGMLLVIAVPGAAGRAGQGKLW